MIQIPHPTGTRPPLTSPLGRLMPGGRLPLAGILGLVYLVAAAPANAGPLDLFYERTVMTAADGRCRLFDPQIGAALNAARLQARGAALRSGARSEAIAETERRARAKAADAACGSRDLNLAAGRVRTAFEGYSRIIKQEYPGDVIGWTADRSVSREGVRWKLYQSTAFGWDRMKFGVVGQYGAGALTATAAFADGATPYSARLVIRDVGRTAGPYLDSRSTGKNGKLTLAARIPPRSASRVFTAESRILAAPGLEPLGSKAAWSFRFPEAAADALGNLDPREAATIEFLFSGPKTDTIRRAYVEVGDFAAGRAFLAASVR